MYEIQVSASVLYFVQFFRHSAGVHNNTFERSIWRDELNNNPKRGEDEKGNRDFYFIFKLDVTRKPFELSMPCLFVRHVIYSVYLFLNWTKISKFDEFDKKYINHNIVIHCIILVHSCILDLPIINFTRIANYSIELHSLNACRNYLNFYGIIPVLL